MMRAIRPVRSYPSDHWIITEPPRSHTRPARCEEVDCPHYLRGWTTTVKRGSVQANYIRFNSERRFRESLTGPDTVQFVFEPGQQCFRMHRVKIGRPSILIHATNGTRTRLGLDEFTTRMNEAVYQMERKRKEG